MADITIRKDTRPAAAAPASPIAPSWEPLRAMRDLLQWDPFQEMRPLWSAEVANTFNPAFEVKETDGQYLFKADVPGVKETDIDVTITGNRLTISGQRTEEQEEKTDTYYSRERKYGSFCRSYTLPEGADVEHIHAEVKGGVLTVAVPKLPAMQPKKIAVKAAPTKA